MSERRVRQLCSDSRIVGAFKTNSGWLMQSPVKFKGAGRSRGRPRSSAPTGVSDSSNSLTIESSASGLHDIDLALITENLCLPRAGVVDEQVELLATDIHDRGLLNPITVRPVVVDGVASYEVVSGARRLAAIRLLTSRDQWHSEIPAHVRPMSDTETILAFLANHGHRVDLDIVSAAKLAKTALEGRLGLKPQEVADAMGLSVQELRLRRRLLRLPEPVLAEIASGQVLQQAAALLLSLYDGRHAHHDIAESVISRLVVGPEKPPYGETLVVRELQNVLHGANWYRLTPHAEASWAQQFMTAAPTHVLPGDDVWTCDRAAAMEAIRAHNSSVRYCKRMKRIRQDPLIRIVAPGLRGVDDLTDVQRDDLGTRVGDMPADGWWVRIDGEGYWRPPSFFDREECFTSCVKGAVITAQGIVCTNRSCFDGKLREGADRQHARIASDVTTAHRNWELLESVKIALSGYGRLEHVAVELSAFLLGQEVALIRRPVVSPNRHVNEPNRATNDPLQDEIREMLGTGPPKRSDHMWSVQEAQGRARRLPGQQAVNLLKLLVSYALDRPKPREFLRFRELPPSIVEVTVSDSGLRAELDDGRSISVPFTWVPWLVSLRSSDRRIFELRENGRMIHWPHLGESLWVDELLAHGSRPDI